MYRLFGYDDMCVDFDYTNLTFVQLVKNYLTMERTGMYVVFVEGVSPAVENKLRDLAWA